MRGTTPSSNKSAAGRTAALPKLRLDLPVQTEGGRWVMKGGEMPEKAFTIPECYNCGAHHEAIGKWTPGLSTEGKWHCFECRASGTFVISYDVSDESTIVVGDN